MSKHAPGPWRTHTVDCTAIVDTQGNDIAKTAGKYDDKDYERMEANARLIAAAPELLDALRALYWHADIQPCPHPVCTIENCAVMRAERLLAKVDA